MVESITLHRECEECGDHISKPILKVSKQGAIGAIELSSKEEYMFCSKEYAVGWLDNEEFNQ